MTTIRLRQRGSLLTGPVPTQDAPRHDTLSSTMNDIERGVGVLDPDDLAEVRRILQKYTGASSTTNQLGGSRAGDTADAGRAAAARVRANVENNAKVASGYRDFWTARNKELADSIRR
jgi:hypothetical protein